ncbi:RIP metalloprotease RseP [Candidatus Uhrbacteria bacterium]|nr:RIP metalloprotease RseP [Candidatus Uhrbacteria bacterium]
MLTFLLFVLVLTPLVLFHEFGHFLTARFFKIKVDEFGFGFPPRAKGWKDKTGMTWSLNWLPLGGFVRLKGEAGDHKEDPDSFSHKPAWQRFLVLVAGVCMNMVLASLLYGVGFMVGLPSIIDAASPGGQVRDQAVRVMSVLSESPASDAGIAANERLVSINGQTFVKAEDARLYIEQHQSESLTVVMENLKQETYTRTVTPRELTEVGRVGLGVGLVTTGLVSYPFFQAIVQGVIATFESAWGILATFSGIIGNLFAGKPAGVDLSGPVGIAVMTGEVAGLGVVYLLQFAALLSINLAILNVLPFPALDGGRILFVLIEKLRGKPVSRTIEATVHNIGFAILMLMVLVVTFKDVVKIGAGWWGG